MLTKELKVLKYVKRHKRVTKKTLYSKFPYLEEEYYRISDYFYIRGKEEVIKNGIYTGESLPVDNSTYCLSRKGEEFFEQRRSKFLSQWFPYIITTIIAATSVIVQFLNLFK